MTKEFQAKFNKIQVGLKVNKSRHNSFGNYNYRSCEDITEALKPLLKETGCVLTISDEVVCIGERIYIKATSTLYYGDESISSSAFSREPSSKKGTDESQITGAASSYSRKYSLSGLLCIDDGIDADVTNMHDSDKGKKQALAALKKCKTEKELQDAWNYYGSNYGNDEEFRSAYAKLQMEIYNA